MFRFILWSLVFYGIYRLIWPVKRLNHGANQSAQHHNSGGTVYKERNSADQQTAAQDAKASARSRAASSEGDYIEYEEIR